jgi:hypothetical protein
MHRVVVYGGHRCAHSTLRITEPDVEGATLLKPTRSA